MKHKNNRRFYIVLILSIIISLALFIPASMYAYESRGAFAVGGEFAFFFVPFLVIGFRQSILDVFDEFK